MEPQLSNEKIEKLNSLVDRLLSEPFAREHMFENSALETVGKIIAEGREKYEFPSKDGLLPPDYPSMKESFDRCKNTYCELLLELGDTYVSADTLSLAELKHPLPSELPALPEETGNLNIQPPLLSNLAKDYLTFADHLQSLRDENIFLDTPIYFNRAIAINLGFAVEAECAGFIDPSIKAFWPFRESAMQNVVSRDPTRFDFHPEVKQEIDRASSQHGEWLMEGRFPYSGLLHSLRYIQANPIGDRYRPSLLETAGLLFLFGQRKTLGTISLKNWLQVSGLNDNEFIELVFKLCRIQKIRNKTLVIDFALSENHLIQLRSDLHRVVELVHKLQFNLENLKKEVA